MKSLKSWQLFIAGILTGLIISATILLVARQTSRTEIQYLSPTLNQTIPESTNIEIPSSIQSDTAPVEATININTATLEQLDSLPGIGEQKAQAIIDYRIQNGEFHSLEDLLYVPGIGKSLFNQIEALVSIN